MIDEKLFEMRRFLFVCTAILSFVVTYDSAAAQENTLPQLDEVKATLESADKYEAIGLLRVVSRVEDYNMVGYILDNYKFSNEMLGAQLMNVSQKGSSNLVKIYLEHGANPNHEAPYGAGGAIFVAHQYNDDIEVMKLLVEYGADVNQAWIGEPYRGSSLFYLAYTMIYPEVINNTYLEKFKLLGDAGSKPFADEVRDERGGIKRQYVIDILGYFPEVMQ